RLEHRLLGGVDRALRLGGSCLCDPGDRLTGVRRAHLDPVAGLDPFPCDEELALGDGCGHGASLGILGGMALDIRYARSGGVSIAYQVVGDGEIDLLYVPDYVSNLVYGWETPYWRGFYEALAERFRLILFDKRGTGLSDLGGQFPALETRMDDVRAVLDAAGSSGAVLLGSHDGCSMAALYAATYPERTRALVLFHPIAHDPEGQSDAARTELAELRD